MGTQKPRYFKTPDAFRKWLERHHCIRFTPRRSGSKWSDVNLKKVAKLKREGLMTPAGLAAYEKRVVGRRAGYAYEENVKQLTPVMIREFRSHRKAWEFFQAQAPSHKKKVTHWITSAKQEATRERRLSKLIEACERGEARHLRVESRNIETTRGSSQDHESVQGEVSP